MRIICGVEFAQNPGDAFHRSRKGNKEIRASALHKNHSSDILTCRLMDGLRPFLAFFLCGFDEKHSSTVKSPPTVKEQSTKIFSTSAIRRVKTT
jgi:hypothetical protein